VEGGHYELWRQLERRAAESGMAWGILQYARLQGAVVTAQARALQWGHSARTGCCVRPLNRCEELSATKECIYLTLHHT
jgi:hypothetical protein